MSRKKRKKRKKSRWYQKDMNSGYHGWSMSKRAVQAYDQGEMPKYKWKKSTIVEAIKDYCNENGLKYDPAIEKKTKAQLWQDFMICSSWHHTSKYANKTYFYSLETSSLDQFFERAEPEDESDLKPLENQCYFFKKGSA